MALKSFGRGVEGGSAPMAPAPAPSGGGSPGGLSAFIDQGSEFEGKLSFKDTVRIDGRFRGEIASENTLIVGESGEIEACIRSRTIVVSGNVEGDVIAATKVVLHKTGRVAGNIETRDFALPEGVIRVRVLDDAGQPLAGIDVCAEPELEDLEEDRFPGFRFRMGWSGKTNANGDIMLRGLLHGAPMRVFGQDRSSAWSFERLDVRVSARGSSDELVIRREAQ